MRVCLISSCTNRKKLQPQPQMRARELPGGTLDSIAAEWSGRVSTALPRVRARDLYAGRAFTEAVAAAEAGKGGLHVVSAGLGLISADSEVPAYSLTVAGNDEDNVLRKVRVDRPAPSSWWTILNRALGCDKPLAALMARSSDDLFVIALPSTYLDLLADELESLPASGVLRIRLVGLSSLEKLLPAKIAGAFVPYDERLEAVAGTHAGTRSDFPQRAARHFIESILVKDRIASAEEHARQVAKFLDGFERPQIPTRERHTDEMLKEVIRGIWSESQGRVTNGLRVLRRERQIACEQSRFKRLFWEVAEEKGAQR
jgi:hypothetical protein